MTRNESLKVHYGYIIVFCCCLIMGINVGLVMSSAGIFYRPVSSELGVPVGQFGLYMSFNYLASSLMLSVAGRQMKKYGARILLTISSAVMGLCLLAMSFFTAVWQFYVAGCVLGVTLSFLLYLSFPTLINSWFKTRVGFFMGICSAASGIGGIMFNPVCAYLISAYGWRMTYAIFGVIILCIVSPFLGLLLRNQPEDKGLVPFGEKNQERGMVSSGGTAYADAIKMPVFYGMLLFAFFMIATSTLNLFIPNYVNGLSYSLEQASFAASAVMLGVTIGKIALGVINDKNNTVGVLITAGFGVSGLGLLLLGEMGIAAITVGCFLFGWAYAAVTVQTPMLVRAVFGSKDYPQIYSNVSMAFAIGGALTAGGWGLAADFIGFKAILSIGILFLVLCGVIGVYALNNKRFEM